MNGNGGNLTRSGGKRARLPWWLAGLKNYKTNFRGGEMRSFAGVVSVHNEDRSNGCCALVFSPCAGGRERVPRTSSFRVGETSTRVRCPLRAWADLIGGRSADRRRILTRRAHVVSVFANLERRVGL